MFCIHCQRHPNQECISEAIHLMHNHPHQEIPNTSWNDYFHSVRPRRFKKVRIQQNLSINLSTFRFSSLLPKSIKTKQKYLFVYQHECLYFHLLNSTKLIYQLFWNGSVQTNLYIDNKQMFLKLMDGEPTEFPARKELE